MPLNGKKIFSVASSISKNIAFYVPKNTNRDQLITPNHKKGRGFIGDQSLVQLRGIQENRRKRPEDKKRSDIMALTVYYGPAK